MSKHPDPRSRPRGRRERVKTARGRKASSTRWLKRQLNDPYVAGAKRAGYRARSAFKLKEIAEKYRLFKGAKLVVDLGAAPGSWCQVVRELAPDARVIAVDVQEMEPLAGVEFIRGDFLEEETFQRLLAAAEGGVDVVLSDMANPATGHRTTDHLKTMALAEAALDFALRTLRPGGAFLAKVLQGGSEQELLATCKQRFAAVRHVKPPASRKDSRELYLLATGCRG